jgi:hypothetical protein
MTRNAGGFEVVVIGVHFVLKTVAVGGFFHQRVLVIKRANHTKSEQYDE